MRHHQLSRIAQVFPYRLVHLIQLELAGKARGQDLRAHAAHQVSPDGATRMRDRVDVRFRLHADIDQTRPAEQLRQTPPYERIGAVHLLGAEEYLGQPVPIPWADRATHAVMLLLRPATEQQAKVSAGGSERGPSAQSSVAPAWPQWKWR